MPRSDLLAVATLALLRGLVVDPPGILHVADFLQGSQPRLILLRCRLQLSAMFHLGEDSLHSRDDLNILVLLYLSEVHSKGARNLATEPPKLPIACARLLELVDAHFSQRLGEGVDHAGRRRHDGVDRLCSAQDTIGWTSCACPSHSEPASQRSPEMGSRLPTFP